MKPEPINPETESSSTIKADHDFLGAVSPHCIIHDPVRRDAVRQVVTDYARDLGLDATGISHACDKALRALNDGHTAHRAIQAGEAAVEWYTSHRNHTPVTAAWNAAQSMGLSAIHCTASGVAGYYGRMYVAISANNGD